MLAGAEGLAGAAAPVDLPNRCWRDTTAAEALEALENLAGFCRGEGHPELRDGPRLERPEELNGVVSYVRRAEAVLRWCLAMSGHPRMRPDVIEIDFPEHSQAVLARRFAYFWGLYGCLHRHLLQQASNAPAHRITARAVRQLGFAFEVLTRVEQVRRGVNELMRLQENSADHLVPDVVRSGRIHANLMMLWFREGGPEDAKKPSERQELILYLLDCALTHSYRRREGVVYEERKIEFAGRVYGTRAWEPACFARDREETVRSTMEAFVHRFCRKEVNRQMWAILVQQRDSGRSIVEYLNTCDDTEFPELRPKRNILSFRNGIYDTDGGVVGAWYPHDVVNEKLGGDVAAAKFFDMEIEESWLLEISQPGQLDRWWNIETPLFQGILDYQNWGGVRTSSESADDGVATALEHMIRSSQEQVEAVLRQLKRPNERHLLSERLDELRGIFRGIEDELSEKWRSASEAAQDAEWSDTRGAGEMLPERAQRWVYIFLGRLLHELGRHDTWQIIPFFKGAGGTGKSTIAQVAKNFFHPQDVGILSNNSEKKFGLQGLLGKFVFLCMELKKNVSLDQAEFQSMVSGEEISVAVKNKCAQVVQWRIPGLLCGNESPGWVDAQGSIARRMAVVNFRYRILEKDSNPELLRRIVNDELAALIVKCNAAYRHAAACHYREDIWNILPSYFKDERLTMQRDCDPLVNLIWDSHKYELASQTRTPSGQYFMPFADLETDYHERHKKIRQSMFPDPLNADKYMAPFHDAGLSVVDDERQYHGVLTRNRWVLGIRLRGSDPAAAQ
jgi:hypothetical protein